MAVTIPLDKMTMEEKIQTMEALWEDLCKSIEGVPSLEWHGKILKNREASLECGDDKFIDWEEAKNGIRNEIS